ncbi:MAG TPA: AI-2E family transporter [Egibacteraceae bacterium]|nr:AI-2E family transporter [Egibacteraceae bacterium]
MEAQPPSPSEARLKRATYRVWLAVGVLVLIWAAARLLWPTFSVILPPVLLAIIITYLLNPIVSALHSRGYPRWLGTTLAYVIFGLGVVAAGGLLLPLLAEQLARFAQAAPELGPRFISGVNDVLQAIGMNVRVGPATDPEQMGEAIRQFLSAEENRTAALALLGGIGGLATGLLHLLLVFVVGPVLAFYVLVDLPRLARVTRQAIPPRHRAEAQEVAGNLGRVVGGYVRGQLLVALFVGVASTLMLAAIQLPFWLVIGIIAGVTNLVPLIGPLVAGLLGVSVALLTDGGITQALLVVVVLTAVQQVDNHVVSPVVVGRTVELHPMIVLLALLVAGTLYGILGLLLAVPAVAAINVLIQHVWQTRIPWVAADERAEEAASAAAELSQQPAQGEAVLHADPQPVISAPRGDADAEV